MATLNRVMLIGRLTDNPEPPRVLPNSGATVVKFRMAVGKSKKNQQTGQWENDPNPLFIDCEAFSRPDDRFKITDVINQYLTKGKQVYVEGMLRYETWQDKNGGGTRSKHKMIVDSVQFLDSGQQQGQGGGGYGGQPQQQQQPPQNYGQPQAHGNFQPPDNQPGDENIPF